MAGENLSPSPNLWHGQSLFCFLQFADLMTTWGCFHVGLSERNPLTALLIAFAGVFGGLLIAKLLCCAALFRLKRLLWLANSLYVMVVVWNLFLFALFGVANHKL